MSRPKRKSQRTARRTALQRAVAEALEPRWMLSDDFDIGYGSSPNVATVRIWTAEISINVSVDCDSVTVNGERADPPPEYQFGLVEIYGTGGNDHITVTCSCDDDDHPHAVRVYAGYGNDYINLSGFGCGKGIVWGEEGNDTIIGSPNDDGLN